MTHDSCNTTNIIFHHHSVTEADRHDPPRPPSDDPEVGRAEDHPDPGAESSRQLCQLCELTQLRQLPRQQRRGGSRHSGSDSGSDHQEVASERQQETTEAETEAAAGSLQHQQGGLRPDTSNLLQAETENPPEPHQQQQPGSHPSPPGQAVNPQHLHQPEGVRPDQE